MAEVSRGFGPGDLVYYTCEEGFLQREDTPDAVICLISGGWSRLRPVCQPVDCGQPPLLDNGVVAVEVRVR